MVDRNKADVYNKPAPVEMVLELGSKKAGEFEKKYTVEDPLLQRDFGDFDKVCDVLIADSELNIPTIVESVFVTVLWPQLLANSKDVNDDRAHRTWVEIAGALDRPIRVVNPAKEILFILPPMIEPVKTRSNTGGSNISAAIVEYNNSRRQRPQEAIRRLHENIRSKVSTKGTGEEFRRVYGELVKRYGGVELTLAQQETTEVRTQHRRTDDVDEEEI